MLNAPPRRHQWALCDGRIGIIEELDDERIIFRFVVPETGENSRPDPNNPAVYGVTDAAGEYHADWVKTPEGRISEGIAVLWRVPHEGDEGEVIDADAHRLAPAFLEDIPAPRRPESHPYYPSKGG